MTTSTPEHHPIVAHLTTIETSLAVLLLTELEVDIAVGMRTIGISAAPDGVSILADINVEHVVLGSLTRAWRPSADVRSLRDLVHQLRLRHVDVLHTHTPKAGVLGRIAGHLARVPVVVNTCHGLWATPEDSWRKRWAVNAIESFAALFSDAELYQNPDDRSTLRWTVRDAKTEVVGNGVDLSRFQFDPVGRERVRTELNLEPGAVLVGGVGRLVDEKGLREFAAAAEQLGRKARFIWVGAVDDGTAEKFVSHAGTITFLGARADMPAIYSAIDVFVLPSHREGFPRSAMEAAACGRAMVLTNIRGCREIGIDRRELLFVPARDPEALSETIAALIQDSSLRARLGDAAARRAMAHFDQRVVALRSLRTYSVIATEKRLGWGEWLASRVDDYETSALRDAIPAVTGIVPRYRGSAG
jgi:glycosyltransferase involved in cell wall biosynthesis